MTPRKLCEEMDIKYIELADNSSYKCPKTHYNIHLLEGHTLTHGFPRYYQFGFIPRDKENRQVMEINSNIVFKSLVKDVNWKKIFDKLGTKNNDKFKELINNEIMLVINKNSNKSFIKMAKYLMENYCELFEKIYKNLYNELGLEPYSNPIMILYLPLS